jgi:hypothetical protein
MGLRQSCALFPRTPKASRVKGTKQYRAFWVISNYSLYIFEYRFRNTVEHINHDNSNEGIKLDMQ